MMRVVSVCFSILQLPRCRIHTLARFWWERFHGLGNTSRNIASIKLLASHTNGLEGGYSRKWIRRSITTETEGKNKYIRSSKSSNIKISGSQRIQTYEVQEKVTENTDLAKLVTVIAFDIETTGFSRVKDRIIEIGLQDLRGGENSTFQTLVNPERIVLNHQVHGITTNMVNNPYIPRMEELIPILLQYVQSRQKPEGIVLWVAHNARCFDVPFLISEFRRCNTEIPENWRYLDSLPLSRERLKSEESNSNTRANLQSMREFYGLPLVGSAHRVLSDVSTLSLILQRLTFDLKLSVSDLLDRSFTASEIRKHCKKNKN